MATAALATALLLLQAAADEKIWEYHGQSAAPASPKKPAEESVPWKATLTCTIGSSAAFDTPQALTKLTKGVVSSYEIASYEAASSDKKPLKIEFVSGEVRYKHGDNPAMTRKLRNMPEAVIVERREEDPGTWVHLVRSDRFKKLKKAETVRAPIYSVNGNTHFEVDIQAVYAGDVQLAGSKGKIKTRRYEVARDKTRWSLWVDDEGSLVASKTVAWVRGEERFLTTHLSRADLFDSAEVKAAPKE